MQRNRSFRRHHRARLRRRRLRYNTVAWAVEEGDRRLGRALSCVKPCSCEMCGNPRRHFGRVTRQEEMAREEATAEIEWWLAVAESVFEFWDNEVDDAYSKL